MLRPALSASMSCVLILASAALIGVLVSCAPPPEPESEGADGAPTAAVPAESTADGRDEDDQSAPTDDSTDPADETPMSVDLVGPGIWVVRAELPSPDGEHVAIFEQEGPWPMDEESGNRAVLRLKIVPSGSESTAAGATPDTTADGGSLVADIVQTGHVIPTIALEPYRWSDDGSSLYWRRVSEGDGCRQFLLEADLHRWDLASQSDTVLVEAPGLETYECDPCPREPTLSPDESRVAFVTVADGSPGVVIRDFGASANQSPAQDTLVALEPFDQAGSLTWSPSGDAVAVVTATSPCENELRDVWVVDVPTGTARVLIEASPDVPFIVDWTDSGIVVRDGSGGWLVDPVSGVRDVYGGATE